MTMRLIPEFEGQDVSRNTRMANGYNRRPNGIQDIEGGRGVEVYHHTGGRDSLGWLQGGNGVSCHLLVGKLKVWVVVPFHMRSWHAGYSLYGGREDVNTFSVGWEIENLGNGTDPYTEFQYECLAYHSAKVEIMHGITKRTTHREIRAAYLAKYPQRARPYQINGVWYPAVEQKTDPRNFDMNRIAQRRQYYLDLLRPPAPPPGAPEQHFSETGRTVRGAFLERWRKEGWERGLLRYGFPVSEEMAEAIGGKLYRVQYFQRGRFEIDPDKTPTEENVTEGLTGYELYRAKYEL